MKVTLHEVAARADLSIATVSRAVNGLPVSQDSLKRVRKAVAELGYVANEAARSLRSERTLTMGVIFSDLRNTLGIELLDALSESIEDAGYSLLISTARGSAERYDLLMHRFLERRVDALFVIRPPHEAASLLRYESAGTPVLVMFAGAGAFADLPIVRPVFSEAGKDVFEHLRDAGHKRVAVIRSEVLTPATGAIIETLKSHEMPIEIVQPAEGEGIAAVLSGLMSKKQRSTAIVAQDPVVRGLLAACASSGLSVPDDLSVISVNDVAADPYHKRHGISSVIVDPHRIGRAAGGSMLAWLAGSRPSDRIRVQTGRFVARGTSGPLEKR